MKVLKIAVCASFVVVSVCCVIGIIAWAVMNPIRLGVMVGLLLLCLVAVFTYGLYSSLFESNDSKDEEENK